MGIPHHRQTVLLVQVVFLKCVDSFLFGKIFRVGWGFLLLSFDKIHLMLDFFLRFLFRCRWIFWRIKRTYLTWISCFAHAGRHWAGLANSFVIIVGLYEVCFSFKIMFLLLLELLYWSAVMVNIGWFLGPLNLVESFTVGTFPVIHFRLSFVQQLINLVDDHVDFVGWKLMKVSLWGHHEKRCNNYFAIEHEPDEFDVIVAVLFPKVVGGNVGEFS